ncbi:uncharacterized protein LOC18992602 isoform X2 [Eutrema salsugineum]|uniref:uncharacterized protein LOC18992602 isoform X2 n=1 Tax=Eutrema salsugineum TaxID=72664 RepID=UPI000CED3818|nr:uncharacterized protein LOC18992602 isoform X2 [Eutrema salsugineum]
MGIFPGFGSWINQNTQQSHDQRSGNVKQKSMSEENTHEERDEMKEQLKLWRDENKKKQWYDPPPKVKVETRNDLEWGLCHMQMEFTLGLPPQAAYDVLTNPDNQPYSKMIKNRELLENISRKIESENKGKNSQIVDSEKALSWNFLWWSGTIPIRLYFIEKPRELAVLYGKQKNEMRYMAMFEGSYEVEPMYVDSERFCKHMKPKSREEYRKCSGGQGRIASKVKLDQIFKPSPLFNVPPISWFIRKVTVKTTKTLAEDLQTASAVIRGI